VTQAEQGGLDLGGQRAGVPARRVDELAQVLAGGGEAFAVLSGPGAPVDRDPSRRWKRERAA